MSGKNKIVITLILIFLILYSIKFVSAQESNSSSFFPGIGIIISIWMLISISNSDKESMKETGGKKVGVHGWLLFFIGFFAIGSIIGLLSSVVSIILIVKFSSLFFFSFMEGILTVLEILVDISICLAILYSATALWKVKKNALRTFYIVFFVELISDFFYIFIYSDGIYVLLGIAGIIGSIITLFYFLLSERVRNTYKNNLGYKYKKSKTDTNVKGWLLYSLLSSLLFSIIFGAFSYTELHENYVTFEENKWAFEENKVCHNFCYQNSEFETYYFGSESYDDSGNTINLTDINLTLCQCYNLDEEVVAEGYFDQQDNLISEEKIESILTSYYKSLPPEVKTYTLEPGYFRFHKFVDQTYKESKYNISSYSNLKIIFLNSEQDFNSYLEGDSYTTYDKCNYQGVLYNKELTCWTSTGGVAIGNEGDYTATYDLTDYSE